MSEASFELGALISVARCAQWVMVARIPEQRFISSVSDAMTADLGVPDFVWVSEKRVAADGMFLEVGRSVPSPSMVVTKLTRRFLSLAMIRAEQAACNKFPAAGVRARTKRFAHRVTCLAR